MASWCRRLTLWDTLDATAAHRPDSNERRKWRQKKELILAGGRGKKCGEAVKAKEAGRQDANWMFWGQGWWGGIKKNTEIAWNNPWRLHFGSESLCEIFQVKKRRKTELHLRIQEVQLCWATLSQTTRGSDGSMQLRDVGLDNEGQ